MKKAVEKAYRLFVKKVAVKLPRRASIIADCGRKGWITLVNVDTGRVIYEWDCVESFLFGSFNRYSIFEAASILRTDKEELNIQSACEEILKYADCSSAEELLLKLEITG